jgi:hypothetical protein
MAGKSLFSTDKNAPAVNIFDQANSSTPSSSTYNASQTKYPDSIDDGILQAWANGDVSQQQAAAALSNAGTPATGGGAPVISANAIGGMQDGATLQQALSTPIQSGSPTENLQTQNPLESIGATTLPTSGNVNSQANIPTNNAEAERSVDANNPNVNELGNPSGYYGPNSNTTQQYNTAVNDLNPAYQQGITPGMDEEIQGSGDLSGDATAFVPSVDGQQGQSIPMQYTGDSPSYPDLDQSSLPQYTQDTTNYLADRGVQTYGNLAYNPLGDASTDYSQYGYSGQGVVPYQPQQQVPQQQIPQQVSDNTGNTGFLGGAGMQVDSDQAGDS